MIHKRLLTLALAMTVSVAAAGCGDDSPTQSGTPDPVGPVFVLGDGATEDSVLTVLAEGGVDAQFGGLYWEWDGSGLDQVSAVILLVGEEYQEAIADSVQATLAAFVAAGGGLMTTEWMLYSGDHAWGYYDQVVAMAPATYGGSYDYGTEMYTVEASSHPIAQGLPVSFPTPDAGWSYGFTLADSAAFKQAIVVLGGEWSGDAVVAGLYGLGRTVHWNMAGQYSGEAIWSTEVRQVLVNIAKYISGATD